MTTHEWEFWGAEATAPEPISTAKRKSLKLRVWLIDDNTTTLDLFARLMKQAGLEVERTFCGAQSAIAALGLGHPPDAVLLDLHLGPQCGINAIRPIRLLAPRVQVFMLTSVEHPEKRRHALKAGALGFFLKTDPIELMVSRMRLARECPGMAQARVDYELGVQSSDSPRPEGFGISRRPEKGHRVPLAGLLGTKPFKSLFGRLGFR
jgi:DNA-binding NarL/FixJ family response regulator